MRRMSVDVTTRLWIEVEEDDITTSQLIEEELQGYYTLNDDWAVKIQDQQLITANIVDHNLG